MSESQVPFKDFLIFLFHSKSSSPSSTRVSSSGSSNTLILNRDLVKNTLGDASIPTTDNNNPLVNKIKPMKKSQSSQKTTMIYGRQVRKKIISPSPSSPLPASATPEDLGRLNILTEHQVSSISKESKSHEHDRKLSLKKNDQHQPSIIVSDQNQHENNIGQKSHHIRTRRSTHSTIQDQNNAKHDEDVQQKDLQEGNKIQHETLLTGHKDLNHDDDNVPLDPSSGNGGGSGLNNNEIRQESQSTSSNSSYRELLGEYDYHHLHHHDDHHAAHNHTCRSKGKNNENDNSIIIDDNNIDFQYDDHDHLHVHENHDLSFYKNFSATTRSKSSTACSIFSKSITDDNHHYQIHHQHIFYSLSKRLSRSTPIQLDMITSVSKESIVDPMVENPDNNNHHFLESNLYQDDDNDDDNYQYDQFETFPNSRLHSSCDNQRHSRKSSHESTTVGGAQGSITRRNSMINNEDNSTLKHEDLEEVKDQYHQQRKTSLLKMNSKSNPTLSAVDVNCPAIIPRRINTTMSTTTISRERGMSKSKNKRGSENNKTKGSKSSSSSGKTTVTLTMDNTSLFLDTVFVNVKQDVDSSSTIRLFY